MSAEHFLPIFPLLPVLGIIVSAFSKHVLKKGITLVTAPLFTVFQLAAAGLLVIYAPEQLTLQVSRLNASIVFSFSQERFWMLAAFAVPSLFSLFKIKSLRTDSLRTVFLFYLAACSGIILTADVFNFFVFYELMIMSAYVLISVEGKVYASIKYMMVGALSSVFFLTGIIFVYASGLFFSFDSIADLSALPRSNALLIISFFLTAFCIKAALFPASPWLPTCHSAGNGTVSSFLSSFTVVSGFFGMHYLVLLPAQSIGADHIFTLLKILALITMGAASIFIFFDTDIKRVIAGSTAFIAGFIGYLFATGEWQTAWVYILVHAVYKSILFHAVDDLDKQPLSLKGRRFSFIIIGIGLLFATGIFPSVPHFLKQSLHFHSTVFYGVFYGSASLLLAGFLKFSFSRSSLFRKTPQPTSGGNGRRTSMTVPIYVLAFILLCGLYVLLIFPGYARTFYAYPELSGIINRPVMPYIFEGLVLGGAVFFGRFLFPRLSGLANLDSRYIFRTLSIELFALFSLFGAIFIFGNRIFGGGY